ncbi:MAG: PAS domain-containing protein, partial [Coleofasciculaceae cyanobacterium]
VHAYPSDEGLYVYFDDITQRKHAEEALRQSEERFQLIAQATNETVWDWDLLTNSIWWNEGIHTIFGYSPEVVGTDVDWWYENLHPEDCQRVASQIQAVIDSNESSWSDEYRYRCANGSYAYVFDRGKVLRDESGKPVRMIGGMMDITKRKQAEARLRIAQEQLSHLLTSSPAVIYSCQPGESYQTTFISENISLMLGYDSQEVMADKDFWLKHFHPEDLKRILPEPNRIFEQGSQILEYRFKHKDETYRWLRDELKLVRDDRGEPIEVVGCCVDITERKLAEEELQRQHRCSQLFAEITLRIRQSLNLEEILATTVTEVQKILQVDRVLLYRIWPNATGRAVTEAVNPGWSSILDRSFPEEVFPQEYQEIYRQGKVQAIADVELAYAETTPCLLQFLKPWCVKAKLVVPILLSGQLWGLLIAHHCASPRPWSRFETDLLQQLADQIAIALSQAQLLEQETRQRKELAISNAELQEFAYVASHDLQEPLRKIQAFGDRLESKFAYSLTDQGRDYLERMQNAAERMQCLIEDLLSLSRITTKARPFVDCSLNQVVQEVVSDLEIRIQQTYGQIEVEELPTIEADPVQMRQLLQNLIANALKFGRDEEPPVIKIYSRLLQEQAGQVIEGVNNNAELCQIFVADNGIGFEEKYLDRIFKAFQRLHGRSQYQGTGMGLAICRKIAERHGGSITAESRPGEGATFIVTLPLKQSQ